MKRFIALERSHVERDCYTSMDHEDPEILACERWLRILLDVERNEDLPHKFWLVVIPVEMSAARIALEKCQNPHCVGHHSEVFEMLDGMQGSFDLWIDGVGLDGFYDLSWEVMA